MATLVNLCVLKAMFKCTFNIIFDRFSLLSAQSKFRFDCKFILVAILIDHSLMIHDFLKNFSILLITISISFD